MSIEEKIEQYKLYRQIAVGMDICTIGIFLCILIALFLQKRKISKDLRIPFVIYIVVMLLEIATEIGSWATLFDKDCLILYKLFTTLDYFIAWFMPATTVLLIIKIIEYKVSFKMKYVYIYLILYPLFASLLFIPGFRNLILVFNDNYVSYKVGPLCHYYYIIETILCIIGLVVGILKSKGIGIINPIIFSLLILSSITMVYFDYWWASTISCLLGGCVLILLFSYTLQTRLALSKEKEVEKELELIDTRRKLLLSQIQPHFLFNTLTTLKFLCETSPSEASELCDTFANYLRSNIDAANDIGLVDFEKELENIENYLKIEKARFGSRVNYVFDIQAKDFFIPVLSIQTIVENALKKGICAKVEGGTIKISTKDLDKYIEIKVSDDGVGFDLDAYLSDISKHTGLLNTKQRIEMINGTVNVESKINEGTTVTIVVPKGEH